jgi:hypothetical protein
VTTNHNKHEDIVMKRKYGFLLSSLMLASSIAYTGLAADEVVIPLGQQGESSVERPPRGTNKAQVEAVYGEPESRHGPTGGPPIYRWEYPDYTVYFEGDLVLHTVLKRQQQRDNGSGNQ